MTDFSDDDFVDVNVSEDSGKRYLHLGGTSWVQGSMNMRKPFDLDLEYVQRMMAWMLWWDEEAQPIPHVVQLGLGAASLTKFCHHRLKAVVTAVEINPQVIHVCRHLFKLPPNDEMLQVVQANAADWVADDQHHGVAEALQVDLYDQDAAGPVLDSVEFYANCAKVLTSDGTLVVNLFGRHASYEASMRHLSEVFAHGGVWSFAPTREGNTVVMARHSPMAPSADTLQLKARKLQARWGWPVERWLHRIQPWSSAS
ncbi:MAG: hypothetical protein RLZZ397_930 [Pseudomonadota bacterium]